MSPQEKCSYERGSIAVTRTLLTRLRNVYRDIPAVMINCDGDDTGAHKSWQALARDAGFVPLSGPSNFLRSLEPARRGAIYYADGSHLSDEGNQLNGAIAGDGLASLGLVKP